MEKTKIGIVGIGHLGAIHLKLLNELSNKAEIVGICDIHEDRTKRLASHYNVGYFSKYTDMVKMIDAVNICVPTDVHFEVAKFFLENHIHTFIEKPISTTVAQADELIKRNIHTLILIGVASIFFVTVALFLMFESLIVHRITRLTQAMDSFPEDPPEDFLLPSVFRDELDSVSDNFVFFCDRLKKSQEELLQTKGQAHLSEKMASLDSATLPEKDDDKWRVDKRYPRFDYKEMVSQTPFTDVSFVRVKVRYDGKEQFSLDRYMVKK